MKPLIAFAVLLCSSLPFQPSMAQTRASANRTAPPGASDIDTRITLDSLLVHSAQGDWAKSKAAAIEGYVVQVEREEDGDYHLVLAADANEKDASKWVITEITPQWSKKSASLSGAHLRALYGKQVRVTGWLYYDSAEREPDPRGTLWEIHPVTGIEAISAK